jgi:polyisoprenoid-binding protein YceI
MKFKKWTQAPMDATSRICLKKVTKYIKAHFTLEVKAKVKLKSNIPINAITKINPKAFSLGTKVDIYIYIYIHLPFCGLGLAPR